MTKRTLAADDAETIAARIAELRKEREALNAGGCDCPSQIDAHGGTFKTHVQGCPHFDNWGCGFANWGPLEAHPLPLSRYGLLRRLRELRRGG